MSHHNTTQEMASKIGAFAMLSSKVPLLCTLHEERNPVMHFKKY